MSSTYLIPETMMAVVTTGCGGFDKLVYKEVRVPWDGATHPKSALVKVLAAGVNNTEVNTRMGWYVRRKAVAV